MDESKAILNLLTQFPYKSEDYLRRTYRKCNGNLSATIDAINNPRPTGENGFRNFFGPIFSRIGKLFNCARTDTLPDDIERAGPSSRNDEGFFEINIGEEFANNLTEKFSDSSLILPTGFRPVIEIPVALGRQLYVAYVESVFRQQESHNQILVDLTREDEEFARQLQEEEDIFELGVTEDATVDERPPRDKKISKKKKLIDHPEIHQKPHASAQPGQISLIIFDEPHKPRTETVNSVDERDLAFGTLDRPAAAYREQAQQHLKNRKQFYHQARQCLKAKNHKLANYYFANAKEEGLLYEQANKTAAAAFLAENHYRNPVKNTIDLHHLTVKEAIQALDIFLDDEIIALQNQNLKTKSLMVITGRGKHSPDGIPKIKPAVMTRLKERDLRYSQINPGLLKVHIFEHSWLCNDL